MANLTSINISLEEKEQWPVAKRKYIFSLLAYSKDVTLSEAIQAICSDVRRGCSRSGACQAIIISLYIERNRLYNNIMPGDMLRREGKENHCVASI
jgi:hypothetical protein